VPYKGNGWEPQKVTRFVKSFPTGTAVVRVDTDQGEGYLKALGNPEGPHVLACELVGTIMADRLGLPTFDFSLIEVQEDDEIPLANGNHAQSGPAFITRAVDGFTWGGDDAQLAAISNLATITGLVVLDTWILNCDRYAPNGTRVNRDNVFLARLDPKQERFLLMAIDHTHAFTCGRELNHKLTFIDTIRDENIYGQFPEFRRHITSDHLRQCTKQLRMITPAIVDDAVMQIPGEWQVDKAARHALRRFLSERAQYVCDNIEGMLWPQRNLELNGEEAQ
jgi:hypothetical protein